MLSFEDSYSFPARVGDEDNFGPSSTSIKWSYKKIASFFVPHTTLGAQPTIEAKLKKIMKEFAYECMLLDGGMMQTCLLMPLILLIFGL